MQLSIDAVNIIGVGLEEILKSTGVEADLADLNAGNIVGSMLAGTGITIASAGIAAAAIVISGEPYHQLHFLLRLSLSSRRLVFLRRLQHCL